MWSYPKALSQVVSKKRIVAVALASPVANRMTQFSTRFFSRCCSYSISWKAVNVHLPWRHSKSYTPLLSYAFHHPIYGSTSNRKDDAALLLCCCYFSSNPKTMTSKKSNSSVLLNDSLRFLLTNRGRHSSDTVQVRVVVATDLLSMEEKSPSSTTGPTTSILSNLTYALDIARRHQMDLVGVNLSQTPPVVKVMDKVTLNTSKVKSSSTTTTNNTKNSNSSSSNNNNINKNYNTNNSSQQQKQQEQTSEKNSKKSNTVKEVKFKVGIGENDLLRKIQQVKSYLQKGYICQVGIFCPRRLYKETNAEEEGEEDKTEEKKNEREGDSSTNGRSFDPNNYNIDQRIYEHVHEYILHEPKVKRNKNLTSIVLHPKPNPM